jgi:hypothetical protein
MCQKSSFSVEPVERGELNGWGLLCRMSGNPMFRTARSNFFYMDKSLFFPKRYHWWKILISKFKCSLARRFVNLPWHGGVVLWYSLHLLPRRSIPARV